MYAHKYAMITSARLKGRSCGGSVETTLASAAVLGKWRERKCHALDPIAAG